MSATWTLRLAFVLLEILKLAEAFSTHPLLLVVSFDGFRHDYFTKHTTPGLNMFKSGGTHAPYVRNVFPTKTFPNHHSIATGLFPESHGVLGNEVYDPILKKVLHFGPEMYNIQGITPIWVSEWFCTYIKHSHSFCGHCATSWKIAGSIPSDII
jgi:ectonucleotide pyrophosphatase/phosphodiesterase family protein 5